MAELYRLKAGVSIGGLDMAMVPAGYTEDDVRRLAARYDGITGPGNGAKDCLKPFRALLDGGDRAKA